ncbi:hypothetical protein GL50803_005779 [Giardia duodenalis]|uniref:Uncharacterized protein n=1 Tax=Giardia intestinalis (strain ATCC 50803 / WB clone C6) TaxID=184922 RepID=A8B2K4_GIAIC|nr:hypothetical protein GL50803_005779 [Giardia intestinalis]KAE8302996.1 hypothetical protein GL50803_005779 [Giardia intestinalis]|eukprot:XP_001709992.1 Hypothetical protein GL50803_5779 [Giardia lamblia ATCC 50803]
MVVDFADGAPSGDAKKGLFGLPRSAVVDGVVSPKTMALHKRSRSDVSHTYSSHLVCDGEQRPILPLLDDNKLSPSAEPDLSSRSLCGKSTLSATAVDTCIPLRPVYCRAISAGIQGCRVPALTRSYFAALPSFTAPMYVHLGSCKSDALPTYSIQLHSIKSRYKYAPRPHSKLPGSTIGSGISSAQSPPRLTPSASFSTPSCGTSTPSSCASSVDRAFGVTSRRTPGILSVDCVHDNQSLSIAFATGSRTMGLPPVAITHVVGSASCVE